MESVPKRMSRVQNVKLYMIAEDLYYAMLDAAQSVLMYVGVGPPPPKTAAREVRKHLVEANLLEEEYAKMLDDVYDFRKKVEHKELKEISGKEVDEWIEKADAHKAYLALLYRSRAAPRKQGNGLEAIEVMVKAS